MTPKQKALQLVDIFTEIDEFTINGSKIYYHDSVKCALIVVDHVIQGIYHIDHKHTAVYDDKGTFYTYKECQELKYWQEVEKEIKAL